VENDDVAAARFDAVEDVAEVIEGVKIADGNEDVAGTRADGLGSEVAFHFEMELVHLDVFGIAAAMMRISFREREDDEEHDGEGNARDGGVFFREEIDDGDSEQDQGNQAEAERNFHAEDREV